MIAWQDLFAALALVLIFEGMLPFVSPERWRKMVDVIHEMGNAQLRKLGAVSMVAGLALLYIIKH
ncbi:MAG: DUF2065 domain-containing protein [Gammaproteobacteria bacterium]|nr:DUF2065 domain-containing protein [Gammaproteobacteria bacterium]